MLKINLKHSNFIVAPIFLTVLVFLILFNFNLDKVESVFYDYGVRITKENNKFINDFFIISIDKKVVIILVIYIHIQTKSSTIH